MADKVTTMELKVDLQCPRCYRKIKKVLCKFPEIRDQMYDEKQNKVIITVVTCCPDIIRKRISSKGGRSVESIEIITDKKKEPEKKKEAGGEKVKPKEATTDKKKEAGGEKDKPRDATVDKKKVAGGEKDRPKDADVDKKKESPKEASEKKKDSPDEKLMPKQAAEKKPEAQIHKDVFEPVSGFPTIYPSGLFYNNQPFDQGYGGGGVPMPMPCFHGHGRPCTCYGMPAYEGYIGNRGGYNNTGRFDYFSEENPEACSIM